MNASTKAAARPGRKSAVPRKSTTLRVIARLPFKGSLPVKLVDAAIKQVMARRSPQAQRAVRIVLPDGVSRARSASK